MSTFPLLTDSFGTGHHGDYLRDLADRVGIVVECFLFATPPNTREDETVHKQVALQGMEERFKRNEEYFTNLRHKIFTDPGSFPYPIDPNILGPDSRYSIKYNNKGTSELVSIDDFIREYTYAFLEPPYSIRCQSAEEANTICSQTLTRLFSDLSEFTIRKWSTDWSNYFDSGNEWWGAFLWTLVSNDGNGWWVGASATD
ncbi:hypothetical protein [Armatimonas rosea]|uniref:Uncharacterized protein n=1 Tax=Armatimonas rosea TaxID=685828 RepID=A0A7W9SRX5_ARMRO|nr:hypothetical protein [Armatimonas rosea]MBB6050953.1 hypothetical protein [Armatimonas rosea]